MPSKTYEKAIEQCSIFHRTRKTFSGNGVLKHLGTLLDFSNGIGARSGIEYGCGKGLQYREGIKLVDGAEAGGPDTLEGMLGFEVFKFDPCVEMFAEPPPEPADLVWCVDVLECVPEQDMQHVIEDLARLALKGLFVTVASYPSKKKLPNGDNAHLTVRPAEWWRANCTTLTSGLPNELENFLGYIGLRCFTEWVAGSRASRSGSTRRINLEPTLGRHPQPSPPARAWRDLQWPD